MTTDRPAANAGVKAPILRPAIFALCVFSISYPLGGAGIITLFPGWGLFGLPHALKNPILRRLTFLALLWSAATLISAIVHHDKLVTQVGLYGLVVLLSTAGLYWLYLRVGLRRETIVMLVGLGWLLLVSQHGLVSGYSAGPWKYALAPPVSMIVLGLAWRIRAPRVVLVALLGGLAAISLLSDARFYAGLSTAVALATLVHARGSVTRASVVRQLVWFAVGVAALMLIYPRLAEHGYFGGRAQFQQRQFSGQGINFLFANRPELVQSAWIASHHPLLGIGPGKPLSSTESNAAIKYLIDLGLPMDINRMNYLTGKQDPGPQGVLGYTSHSAAVDSISHAGLLAAPFWIFYGFLLVRMVVTRSREDAYAVPTILWLSLLGLWDVFFSPLTATQWPELTLAAFLATVSASAAASKSGAVSASAAKPIPRVPA